jgi:Ribbon-helix-helix domain
MPIVFSRVTPEIAGLLTRESERRGVKPSDVIREALDMLLKQAEQHIAA